MTDSLFGDIVINKPQTIKVNTATKKVKTTKLADSINDTNLFSDEFADKKVAKKAKAPKEAKEVDAEKILKSKKVSLQEKLAVINSKVLKVLGKQKNNVLVIKDKETLHNYITAAINSGRLAIDTETNNSLDPVTCKLMGPCFYYPGGKQAYVPLNHRDSKTKERFSWQLTEQDIKDELKRVVDTKIQDAFKTGVAKLDFMGQSTEWFYLHKVPVMATKPFITMHNGKFDYEVIKCTCGLEIKPDWDTMIAARLLNENELAGLKYQYVKYIDKAQEKYSIEKLFDNIAYADVDPDIFALYAATDSMMTDKLYEIQKAELDKPEYGPHMDLLGTHEIKGLRWLFYEVEMPIVVVTAEMELAGVAVDKDYGARLRAKYTKQLEDIDSEINTILETLRKIIVAWRSSPEGAAPSKTYLSKKSKMSEEKIEKQYPNIDDIGRYKLGDSKSSLLDDPINLSSPTQLALLFYDILGVPNNAKDGSRKTGKDELKTIKETLASYLPRLKEIETEIELEEGEDIDDIEEAVELSTDEQIAFKLGNAAKLASLILKRRGIAKLVTTYIDVIPELVKHWPDGRIRFHLNSLGTDTGRYSSGGKLKFMEHEESVTVSGLNIQNIPSHNPEIRMLFKAKPGYRIIGSDYSAQEPRMTTFLSGDKKMYDAYMNNQDLYAMIAQSAYNNNYEDNLEFWPEGTELEIDGKKVIAGKKTHLSKAGKERRSVGKVLNLAATYGMSGRTAGIRLGYEGKEAKEKGENLLNSFFGDFSGVKTAIEDSKKFLEENGYVEDFIGRRRRLDDINIDPYEAQLKIKPLVNPRFNPFLICGDRDDNKDPLKIWDQILFAYSIMATAQHIALEEKEFEAGSMSNKTFDWLKKVALNPGYLLNEKFSDSKYSKTNYDKIMTDLNTTFRGIIEEHHYRGKSYKTKPATDIDASLDNEYGDFKNNDLRKLVSKYISRYGKTIPEFIPDTKMNLFAWTGRIAQAKRQCFNARIQGSAASLTKMAMVDIFNDPQLNAWDAKLIITVHDEVLVECKEEYADLVEKRLPEIMVAAAKKVGDDVPQSCDPYNVTRWYSDTAGAFIQEEFKKLEAGDKDNGIPPMSREDALNKVIKNHSEVPVEAIIKTIETGCDLEF